MKPSWNSDLASEDGNSWCKCAQKYDFRVINMHYEGFKLIKNGNFFYIRKTCNIKTKKENKT